MGRHSARRRGAAFVLAGAVLAIGGTTLVVSGGVGSADPLPARTTTYVLPDLRPFDDGGPYGSSGNGKVEVTNDLGAPKGGHDGAAVLSTPADTDKAALSLSGFGNQPLKEWVGDAAYSTYLDTTTDSTQAPSFRMIIDFGPTLSEQTTLSFEPADNGIPATPKQWQRYDVGDTGKLCSASPIPGIVAEDQTQCANGGGHTLAEYLAAAPNAIVLEWRIEQGPGNAGLVSAVDKLEVPTPAGDPTTYDFEIREPINGGGTTSPVTVPEDTTAITPPDPTEPSDSRDQGSPGPDRAGSTGSEGTSGGQGRGTSHSNTDGDRCGCEG